MNVEGIPEPEEDWMFYIHPLGHGLYLREDVDGERRERPVFTHNAAPTWHFSTLQSDQQEYEMRTPSDGFWKAVRSIYVAANQKDEDEYREMVEQAKRIQQTLEYYEADTIDKLFGTLHNLECPARDIEIFDRLFAEVENKNLAEEAKELFKEKYEELTDSNRDGVDESTAEGGKPGVSARKPILTAEELYEGRQRLGTEEQKELFDKQISRAETPLGEYRSLEMDELRKLRRILEKAFPEEDVAPYDIRRSVKSQEIRDDLDKSTTEGDN